MPVAEGEPALWRELKDAQDRFTDLSVLPAFVDEFHKGQIEQQANVIYDIEGRVFDHAGMRRQFSMAPSSDIIFDMGIDQLIAGVNFGNVLVIYVEYDKLEGWSADGVPRRGQTQYLAIVGHAGAPLRAISLGPASDIDALAKAFLNSVSADQGPFDQTSARQLFQRSFLPCGRIFDTATSPTLIKG